MTSPADGRVVTELRGLSAWLAAYPGEARRLLIDADPVGVGLYGDIGEFPKDDKSRPPLVTRHLRHGGRSVRSWMARRPREWLP